MSRVCDLETIGSTIEEDEQLIKELVEFLASSSQSANVSFRRERQLCFQQRFDIFHRLIFTIEIEQGSQTALK